MERQEEKTILVAVQLGRKDRFEAIVREFQGRATGVAMSLMSNRHDALDMSQEAFLRAFKAIQTYDVEQPFFPWFYRILRNVCLSHLKRRRRVFSLNMRSRKDGEDVEVQIPDEAPGPEHLAEQGEEQVLMYEAMGRLSLKDREILHLRHMDDLSYAAIADALSIPIGTVMSRLFYARRRLRDCMEQAVS